MVVEVEDEEGEGERYPSGTTRNRRKTSSEGWKRAISRSTTPGGAAFSFPFEGDGERAEPDAGEVKDVDVAGAKNVMCRFGNNVQRFSARESIGRR